MDSKKLLAWLSRNWLVLLLLSIGLGGILAIRSLQLRLSDPWLNSSTFLSPSTSSPSTSPSTSSPSTSTSPSPSNEPNERFQLMSIFKLFTIVDNQKKADSFEEFELEYIRTHNIFPFNPDAPTDYLVTNPDGGVQQRRKWNQAISRVVAKRLGFKRNGFFVEYCALDGAILSNTIHLERTYGWTGLLVEPDPDDSAILKKRNRHAWVADVCLSPEPRPMKVEMQSQRNIDVGGWSGVSVNGVLQKKRITVRNILRRKFEAQYFPLDMLLAAINRTEIDYFSLEVEKMELGILKTIPFDKIHIKLISVEYVDTRQTSRSIQTFLKSVGYQQVLKISSEEIMTAELYEFSQSL